jgi:hypothetical protein
MLLSGLPELVGDNESLARFLTSSSHFNTQVVKAAAFLPSSDRETSVFRHEGDPPSDLWTIGIEYLGGRTFHGAAIVKAGEARAASLDVSADEPPARHAVIKGWPWLDGDAELQKAQQKERALSIASKAILLLRLLPIAPCPTS